MLLKLANLCKQTYSDPTLRYRNEQIVVERGILAIAGSNDPWDWKQNFSICWNSQIVPGVKATRGYVRAARNIARVVEGQHISQVTGHSKGGAVAALVAMLLPEPVSVTTFAAPKVSKWYIDRMETVEQVRTRSDYIPTWPESWPLQGREILIGEEGVGPIEAHTIKYYISALEKE